MPYPIAPPVGSANLPEHATFWTPENDDESELDNESDGGMPGIGCFHDTWRISGATIEEAAAYLTDERRMATAVAVLAQDDGHFDRLAYAVEGGNVGNIDEGLSAAEQAALTEFAWDVPPDLGELEIGVVSLSYALNAVGVITAASCRGHAGAHAWSSAPVVSFAATRQQADDLQPLVAKSGCTFVVDDVRPDLLVVHGQSILNTMDLAALIIEAHG